jgi:hypothetical protein
MTDNRTIELLRELLDERDEDYSVVPDGFTVWQQKTSGEIMAWEDSDGVLTIWGLTPEQAIDATLGSSQELIDLAHNAWSMALCAMQGMPIPADWGEAVERGLREHGINVDEELAGFEVIDDER